MGLWTGLWALSTASLPRSAALAGIVSPVVTYLLVRHVSGVPPLEKAGDKKFGGDPEWEEYKR